MKLGSPEPIAALNRVKIIETGEPLVDIREFCAGIEIAEHVCPYMRRTAAEYLNRAQARLPASHMFRVGTALRTLGMQKRGWDGYFARMREEHPGWPLSALRRAVNKYYAPYDQPAPPGHCTGGAVDVALLGPTGEPLDLTSPTKGWEAAYTYSEKISPASRANRTLLIDAMLGAGFSNCRDEYWHYSYGDSAWAVRTGQTTCPYGFVKPNMEVSMRFEGACASTIEAAGAQCWRCLPGDANGRTLLQVGVFWAEGIPVMLRVPWPGRRCKGAWSSEDKLHWTPCEYKAKGGEVHISITSVVARTFIRCGDAPPAPPVSESN